MPRDLRARPDGKRTSALTFTEAHRDTELRVPFSALRFPFSGFRAPFSGFRTPISEPRAPKSELRVPMFVESDKTGPIEPQQAVTSCYYFVILVLMI